MTGGLIQLLTIGLQDAPLILNPEITFFKTTYRRHTNFSLEQILKNIGPKNFNTFFQYKITNVTDLLGGLHFVIDIPYFDIVKTIVTKTSTIIPFQINELSILYSNVKTYLLYESTSQHYYLVPETFFNLSKNDQYYNHVDGNNLNDNLLAGLNLLTPQNYGGLVDIFQLKSSTLNQILPVLRLKLNQWDEFWLRIFNDEVEYLYFTNLINQINYVSQEQTKLKSILYNGYINFNVFNKFRNYLDFHNEIINYFSSGIALASTPIYDSDFAKNYAINNSYDINTYTLNALKYNSLFYLFCLQSIYADFSLTVKGYTFWKKYSVGVNNIVANNISNYNYFLEWKNKEVLYNTTSFGSSNNLQLEIFQSFNTNYFETEQNIVSLYNNLTIQFREKTWSIFKVFYNQFTDNSSNIICFDDHFNPNVTNSPLSLNYNINNFLTNVYPSLNNKSNLNSSWSNFDDPTYIQPVDLDLVYPYLSYKYIDSLIVYNPNPSSFVNGNGNIVIVNGSLFIDNHFLVLFRNKITIAYAFRSANNLDNYYSEKVNNSSFQNVFLDLNDNQEQNKNLTFYHNINVNKNIGLDNIRNEMHKLFKCESFYGTVNTDTNNLSANFVLNTPSYDGLNDISYNMINNNVVITDEITFPTYDASGNVVSTFSYDVSNNIISILNWNNTNYEQIFININSTYLEIVKFTLTNNILYLYPTTNLSSTITTSFTLRLIKKKFIPVLDFVPKIDGSGNVNYPNINFNTSQFPDTSFNLIQYPDITYDSTILYDTLNNIVIINNFVESNGNIKLINISFNSNYFYELKIKQSDNSIIRKIINIDGSYNIVPNIQLNFNEITKITLLTYDFGLKIIPGYPSVGSNSTLSQNPSYYGSRNKYYWLIEKIYKTTTKLNIMPFVVQDFLYLFTCPIIELFNYDYQKSYNFYEIESSLVPNLFPILHHYNNIDSSGNVYNYQLNSEFYQSAFILNTFHNGNASTEPLYYFYNLPSNENTVSITINGYTVNKIMPINPSEFYTFVDSSQNLNKYPVVYDPINVPLFPLVYNVTPFPLASKVRLISIFNSTFNSSYLNDLQFSNIVTLIENTINTYNKLYYNTITTLKTLGSTIDGVINNSNIINVTNLNNYNSFNFNSYSVCAPTYYNQSQSVINSGLGIQKFLINQKGFILTQVHQVYDSSKKITADLTNYLNTVSQTLVNNINYINSYVGLLSVYSSDYIESYKPKYYLENTVNQNVYTISNFKITTLFDMSGNISDPTTSIYLNNEIINFSIDSSGNYIGSGTTVTEVSEKKIYSTEIYKYNTNDFISDRFSYLGPVRFDNGNFVFLDSYTFDPSNNYILLDDLTIVQINTLVPNYSKIYYNSYEFMLGSSVTISAQSNIYVYQLTINTPYDSSCNSVLINCNFYNLEYDGNFYYIYGSSLLNITNRYIIFGASSGSINTFIPKYSILVDGYTIINNFETNIYVSGNIQTNYVINNNLYLSYIATPTRTFYCYVTTLRDPADIFPPYTLLPVTLYVINNKKLIQAPFKLGTQVTLVNDNKDFIINNFNTNYYYKLDTSIIKGINLSNIGGIYNFNVSVYSESNLKLVDRGITVDISENLIYFSSTDYLPNYSYYSIDGYVYFIEIIANGYDLSLKNILCNDTREANLYLLHEDNFIIREHQYISILDSSSSEILVPNIDTSGNNDLINYAQIDSTYYFNYMNSEGSITNNELDVIATFTDDSSNNFMIPFSFIYDISSNNIALYVHDLHHNNYHNFFFYSSSDVSNNTIKGILVDPNSNITDVSCNDSNFVIDSSLNFTLNASNGLQKYKLLVNSGTSYNYVWTLQIDPSLVSNYTNIFNIYGSELAPYISSPINTYSSVQTLTNPVLFTINTGYSLVDTSNNFYIDTFNNVIFNNIPSSNGIFNNRQQIYYDSNILINNKPTGSSDIVHPIISSLIKLELNYETLLDRPTNLDYYGYLNIIQGNIIQLNNINTNLKYVVLIGNNSKLVRNIVKIDGSTIYLDAPLNDSNYNVYGFSQQLIFVENKLTIYNINNVYSISSYQYNSLRKGDIIMLGTNIFEVKGLNSFTMFYDLISININVETSYYNGYYLLFRLNATPKIPDTNIVEFNMNLQTLQPSGTIKFYNVGRLSIDDNLNIVFNIYEAEGSQHIITDLSNNFSIPEGEEITLTGQSTLFYNLFNYQLKNNDYLQWNYEDPVYRIINLHGGCFNIVDMDGNFCRTSDFLNDSDDLVLKVNFYHPYQPCSMINLNFDGSGNITNQLTDVFYYEVDGIFTNETNNQNFINSSLYTRVIQFPKEHLYFENQTINYLTADISENTLHFVDASGNLIDISGYDFYYNQPIKVNSFINYIRRVDLSDNLIIIDKSNYDTPVQQAHIYFGKRNTQECFNNYKLEKSCYVRPYIDTLYYHQYDISNSEINNYNIATLPSPNYNIIFIDNVLYKEMKLTVGTGYTIIDNQNMWFNNYNLHNSYHILLEQNTSGQFISHLCQFKIPNKLYIFTHVESYTSQFFLDKTQPINLFSDNSFEFKSPIIYKQTLIPSLPYNELVIWTQFDYNLIGTVNDYGTEYSVEIDTTNILQYVGYNDFYLDKVTPCKIVIGEERSYIDASGNTVIYYVNTLRTTSFPTNFQYLYVKQYNYITTSTKNNFTYNTNIIPNSDFDKPYTYDSMKIPDQLTFYRNQNYYYYSLDHDLSVISTPPITLPNITLSTGYVNLKVVETYLDLTLGKRVIETNDEVILLDSIFVNNLSTNIFDPSRIYQDGDGSFKNIFEKTNFIISSLFNPIKPWNNWSLVSNPDISKTVMSQGNLYYDISSSTVLKDTSNNYYTFSEVTDISSFLISINTNIVYIPPPPLSPQTYIYIYVIFNDLITLQTKFYLNLPQFIKCNDFWLDPVTYINAFIIDCQLKSTIINPTSSLLSRIVYDGKRLYYQDNIIVGNPTNTIYLDNIIINNEFDVTFDGTIQSNPLDTYFPYIVVGGTQYVVTRNLVNVNQEIYNLVNNTYTQNVYGVTITGMFNHLVGLSKNYIDFNTMLNTYIRKCVNFADLLLDNFKNILYSKTTEMTINNFLESGLDIVSNNITYDTTYTNSINLVGYPYLPTINLYQTNIPDNINYSVDTSSGLYPYIIQLTNETYADQTIYKIDFLEGAELNNLLSIDYPIVYNNQINFTTQENFDINDGFSIAAYKTYDISSTVFIGYLYTLIFTTPDLNNLDFTLFTFIKYKNMELTLYNSYFIFPQITNILTSYIQAEIVVGVSTSYISGDQTYITLLKLNQVFNVVSTDYTVYFSNNGINYRIFNMDGKNLQITANITKFINTKIIITIKHENVLFGPNVNLVQYELTLVQPLTNYSYYYDLKNVPKNFLINDVIYPQTLDFIGDSGMYVIIKTSDIPSSFNNIVHYSKIGEFPPEPIEELKRENSFLYEFSATPPIIDLTSCFICYDISYNTHDNQDVSGSFLDIFRKTLFLPDSSYNINYSIDVIKYTNKSQFISNIFINNQDLHYHTFGGVINQWYLVQYTYLEGRIRFTPSNNFIFDKSYYYYCNDILIDMSDFIYQPNGVDFEFNSTSYVYNGHGIPYNNNSTTFTGLNNGYIDFSINLDLVIYDSSGIPIGSKPIYFRQLVIEQNISKPTNNQVCTVTLFDPLDIKFNGYIQTLDKTNFELGNYIYLLNIDTHYVFVVDTTVYFNSGTLVEGNVLLSSPLYIVTKTALDITNITSMYIKETNTTYTGFTLSLIINAYIPFTLYKKLELGLYKLIMNSDDLDFLDDFIFPENNLNKFYLVSKFAEFALQKQFDTQIITPSPELVNKISNSIITKTVTEKVKFKDNLYRILFNYIEFYINDQLIEQLNEDVMNFQYQFLKDEQKRKQLDSVVKLYENANGVRFVIPLEFWFYGFPSLYLPIVSLNYSYLSIKYKIDKLLNLITNLDTNVTNMTSYKIINQPEINIQINIDGIILDTTERELFGNNQHEYIIERFKTYPDTLIDTVNNTARMKFKNMVKDIFFSTEIISSHKLSYYNTTVKNDIYSGEFYFLKPLYLQFVIIGVYNANTIQYNKDFDYIRQADDEIKTKSERYTYFMESPIIARNNIELALYLDSKYQQNLITLLSKRNNLDLYFTYNYMNKTTYTPVSTISSMNIQTSGHDLMTMLDSTYYNLIVPYQRYFNSVDPGYYGYSFAINPLEKQPSGHINFSKLDDIVINTVNNAAVVNDPFILKTTVREYQILRIMSGMGALAFSD